MSKFGKAGPRGPAGKHHGAYRTPAYYAWANMKTRCFNPNSPKYEAYGGRGIGICERWLDFRNFLEDMGQPPVGMTLERKDVNGHYNPENCEWADRDTQANNKQDAVVIDGVRKSKRSASRALGLHPRTIYERVRRGWSLEKALTTPKGGSN